MIKIVTVTLTCLSILLLSNVALRAQTLSISTSVTNSSCNSSCNGSISCSASGGSAPYTYSWSNGVNLPLENGLCPGSYTLTVTDAVGVTQSTIATIIQAAAINVVPSQTNVTCNGTCSGSASAIASGGTGAFTYSWSGLAATTPTINNLCAGAYTLTVNDGTNCSLTHTYFLMQPSALTIVPSQTNVTCNGACNGTATANFSGGTAPFSYHWTPNGSNLPTQNNLCAGSYTITVTDAQGCIQEATYAIAQPAALSISASATNANCQGCNGSATAVVSGGNTPYVYSWVPAPAGGQGTAQPTGLCAGTYTVTASDAGGCNLSRVVAINNPANMNVISTSTPTICGGATGTGTVIASGGTAPYTYSWLQPLPGGGQGTANGSGMTSGNYTVSVSDSNGCTYTTGMYVGTTGGPTVAVTSSNSICYGTSTGSLVATATGGTAPYSYNWSAAGGSTPTVNNLVAGVYTVSVVDVNGCNGTATGTITQDPQLFMQVSRFNVSCNGASNGSAYAQASGGTPPYLFSWNTGATADSILHLTSGTYSATVTDVNGCVQYGTTTLLAPGTLYIALNSTPSNCSNNGTASVSAVQGGTSPYAYSWSSTPSQTAAIASSLAAGNYSVVVSDPNGCSATGSVTISANGCKSLIKGRVFNDANNNCVQDVGESGIPNVWVGTTNTYAWSNSDSNGDYTIYSDSIHNQLNVSLPFNFTSACQSLTPIVNINAPGDTSLNNNFAFGLPVGTDLAIHPGWNPARPGFQKEYWIFAYNEGYSAANGVVTFQYDSNLVFNSASQFPAIDTVHHVLTWTLNNIQPGYCCQPSTSQQLHIYFTVPSSLALGTDLVSHFEIDPISGDYNPSNNTLDAREPVTGSHDPNSKTVIPAGVGLEGAIEPKDSVLFYTINFQNSGTDTAFTVIVKDTLSSNLDPFTVIPGAASHPYVFSITDKGEMSWRFDRILLPDSTVNSIASMGSFNYTVKLKKSLPFGSKIRNKAYVYFDFNTPIITNTTINTLVSPLYVPVLQEPALKISAIPNPFGETTIVRVENVTGPIDYVLYDLLGNETRRLRSSEKAVLILRETLPAGMYILRLYSNGKPLGQEKLICR
jgi:hypothetical protein